MSLTIYRDEVDSGQIEPSTAALVLQCSAKVTVARQKPAPNAGEDWAQGDKQKFKEPIENFIIAVSLSLHPSFFYSIPSCYLS